MLFENRYLLTTDRRTKKNRYSFNGTIFYSSFFNKRIKTNKGIPQGIYMKEKKIRIEVWRGVVSEVKNLPEGWTFEIIDLDEQKEKK
jgi:hypothetical protein